MSDMDDESAPSEAVISRKLRDTVIAIHKSANPEDLTIKRVRARAEQELGLEQGFLKNGQWKKKSQDTIHAAVEEYCNDAPTTEPTKAKPATKPTKPASRPAKPDAARGVKRKTAAPAKKSTKRRKAVDSGDESDVQSSEPSAEFSDADSEPPKKTIRRGKKAVVEDSDEEDAEPVSKPNKSTAVVEDSDDEPTTPPTKTKGTPTKGKVEDSDSDMSSLIDESPAKNKRPKKQAPASKADRPAKTKAPPKAKGDADPDQEEVKRLQQWLVKCGIRKVWSKDPELSKCDTTKEKIKVLKRMLKDVGMDGKFSNEKAAKIKEQREFAKDLEAIQEGELAWGKTSEVTATGRPSRRAAARPAAPQPKIVFSDDSEEEGKDQESGDDDDDDDDDDDVVDGSEDNGDEDKESEVDDSD